MDGFKGDTWGTPYETMRRKVTPFHDRCDICDQWSFDVNEIWFLTDFDRLGTVSSLGIFFEFCKGKFCGVRVEVTGAQWAG